MPVSEQATVERFVVVSNRDGEHVVGPLDNRGDADAECDRLREEQMRNWLAGGETAVGEPLKPPGYTVETIDAPDPQIAATAREQHVAELDAKIAEAERDKKAPEGHDLDVWLAALKSSREEAGERDAE